MNEFSDFCIGLFAVGWSDETSRSCSDERRIAFAQQDAQAVEEEGPRGEFDASEEETKRQGGSRGGFGTVQTAVCNEQDRVKKSENSNRLHMREREINHSIDVGLR